MKVSDVIWNMETLDGHLSDMRRFIQDKRMGQHFPADDHPNDQDRADIIAYLVTLAE